MSEVLEELRKAVLDGEDDSAANLARKAFEEGAQPLSIVSEGIVPGINEAGARWQRNEYFTPDVVMAAEAFRAAMEIVEPHISIEEAGAAGKVVIGTVAGDMHDLGKMMVIAMLRGAGFNVVNLGEDVPAAAFIDKVKEIEPDILGLGCYMTTTMPEIRDIIKSLNDDGLRDSVRIMVGGVPVTQKFADEIGADAWGKNAIDAVEKARKLMGCK